MIKKKGRHREDQPTEGNQEHSRRQVGCEPRDEYGAEEVPADVKGCADLQGPSARMSHLISDLVSAEDRASARPVGGISAGDRSGS